MSMSAPVSPPPLREGDCLDSDEFLRRWDAMPDLKHAELLDGIVYMPSPLSFDHGVVQGMVAGWIDYYEARTPGCQFATEATWVMGDRQVPQPDLTLRIEPGRGGQSHQAGIYGAGAPELIIEVAVSSRARDLGPKLRLYERMKVREYVVALVGESRLIWHQLTDAGFQKLQPDSAGVYRSSAFPGLWLDADALWRRDKLRLHAILQQGLASPEHAAFVQRLDIPGA